MRFLIPLALAAGAVALPAALPAFAAEPRAVEYAAAAAPNGALVLPLGSAGDLAVRGAMLDAATRDAVARALEADEFDFALESVLALRGIGPWSQIVILGTGTAPLGMADLQTLGALAAGETAGEKGPVSVVATGLSGTDIAANLAVGAQLGGYSFDRYQAKDEKKETARAPLRLVSAEPRNEAAARRASAIADSVAFTRNLITEPANVLYPETFVARTREAFRGLPVDIEVLDVADMERLGMNSLLAVGRGSVRPPRLLAIHYRGAGGQPIALAGKGITFDSGGISLKPGSGMWEMKGDMSGAAAVVGTVLALAKARAPVNAVAIAAIAENMPGSTATRPGDVVTAMNGKSIEILNTDAEGRLVLADAVAYAERQYRPAVIVDVATLTGSKVGALGDEYAGLFSRNDALAMQLEAAGKATGELLWRLPLHPNHAKDMKSDIADIKNVVEGGGPGASLGAHFISFFVSDATPWAHLDIAGNEMGGKTALAPTGVTGFGVRLLEQFARSYRPVAAASGAAQ